jgi:glycosyltransferase involved in cell wall biosynthesis
LVRATKPEVIHFLGDSVVWLTLALPLLRGYAKVVTVHDVTYHPGDTQSRTVPTLTINLLRRSADELIVHGQGLRHALRKLGVSDPDRIHVVDHPVLDRHRRLAASLGLARTPAPGPRILFFGRVMAYKGLNLLIEASDQVVQGFPQARFLVAGTGPELERLRPELRRRPWIEVRDYYIPDAETAQILCDADLLVLPYTEASQSGVLALAAGFSLPVVTTDVGELGALTRRAGMGPVVRPEAAAIAHAIMDLLSNPASLRDFSAAANAAAIGALSPRVVAADTLAVYRRAVAKRSPSVPAFARLERG